MHAQTVNVGMRNYVNAWAKRDQIFLANPQYWLAMLPPRTIQTGENRYGAA